MTHPQGAVFFNENGWKNLSEFISETETKQAFILVDEQVELYCLPYFLENLKWDANYEIIRIPSGEKNKNIQTTLYVWETLAKKGADKKSLIINLGGGMITDLGGFVASTFKRGIPFVHVPTTLLAMVDAAVGGKNGIDFNHIKNQIGTVHLPELIVIDTNFLLTLPEDQFLSGMAEVIKHALIKDEEEWKKLKAISVEDKKAIFEMIPDSVMIKKQIVKRDPYEKKERKILNYGHTLGHAIESYRLKQATSMQLLHGEAVAIGMILETYISHKLLGFDKNELNMLTDYLLSFFPKQDFNEKDIREIIDLTRFDKKNSNGQVRFVLMKDYGKFQIDSAVPEKLIVEAFEFYRKF